MKRLLLIGLVGFAACSSIPPKSVPVLVDVPSLVGKTQEQVTSILGHSSCETEKISGVGEVPTCTYYKTDFHVEITYILGKADWIAVNGLKEEVEFDPRAILAVGLKESSSYQASPMGYFWKGLAGYRDVSVFAAGDRVNYIYVKAFTD